MNWTPAQQEAINYQGENILLSAAAGSGKTAVLVQRVINKILDKENPVSINELLILTFTEAAASEMKKKIAAAINREFLADPKNEHLKLQRILINSANISTIHSFCLEVIKANIHKTDIPVNFSIVSEIENTMLKEQALSEVLEKYYERFEKLPSFKRLALGYGSDKSDKNLRDIIRDIMDFALGMPYPNQWLLSAAKDYKFEEFSASPWYERLFDATHRLAEQIIEIYDCIISQAEQNLAQDHPYNAFFLAEREKFAAVYESIKQKNYAEVYEKLSEFIFERIPTKRTKEQDEVLAQDNIKQLRALAKKKVAELSGFFVSDEETVSARIKESEAQVRTLKNITLMTMRSHRRLKRMKNYLDFNDLEHELIGLLCDKNGNETLVARSLQKKYKEILVDEYQDTNYIQDKMFSLISRNESNVFTVGDIKQSIYKFRNAVPEIFAEKYRRYGEKRGGHLISLAKNFRSRQNIIDFTNFVFEKIMTEQAGNVRYDEKQRLIYGADYEEGENGAQYVTEFNIVDGRNKEDAARCEAEAVAERIKRLVNGKELKISTSEGAREAKYSDVVILMRNTKTVAPIFEEVFEEKGIPLYSESGKSYLTSIEVQTVLSYLSIIDNPHQDIPLIAVLRSPIWKFTPDMLSKIRAASRRGDFYGAMKKAAKSGDVSCARFISELEKLRQSAEYMSVSDLVLTIYTKYNYKELVLGTDGGLQRAENLRLLFERAAEFDEGESRGLLEFMLYIETILSSGKDLTPAKVEGENSNAVKIMSIHKSKGLEFPVVILANAFGVFNNDDVKKTVLKNDAYGFGIKYADIDKRIIYPSIPHKIIARKTVEDRLSEEMRLLYVAMTRAKEKLIISAVIKDRTSAWATPYLAQDKILTAGILSAQSMGDWVAYALARHKDAAALQNEQKLVYKEAPQDAVKIKVSLIKPPKEGGAAEKKEEKIEEEAFSAENILNRLENGYKYAEAGTIPLKISVSEAKRKMSEEEEYYPHIFSIPTLSAKDADMISATDRGTITHFVLLHMDMKKTESLGEVEAEIRRMEREGLLSPAQCATVDADALHKFFQSALGKRLKNAKEVRREFNFYTQADAAEFYPNLKDKTEKILLQGTMDCFFREADGSLVLLDYKTDRVDEEKINDRAQKYKIQLKYYKEGLEAITGERVREAYICFLHCGRNISLDDI